MNSEQLIKDLVKNGVSDQLEFRHDVVKIEIGKSICAFLNHNGGQVLIGVSDDGKVMGVSNSEKWKHELSDYLKIAIRPSAPIMVDSEVVGNKRVISIKVWAGSKQPYIFDGRIFFRRGKDVIMATSQEVSDLIHNRKKAELHWERQVALGVEVEDIDIDEVQRTIDRSVDERKLDESINNPSDFLTHFGLIQNGHFTNAAVVLFAKNPARFIPQTRVRVAFLEKGKTANRFIDDKLLEGDLFKNIFAIQNFLEKYLRTSRKFLDKDWERKDEYLVPMSALREGVINALVHRDYSAPNASISVIIYNDKIEISNSGKSPLLASELRKSHLSMPVNPDIAHITFLRGYMEKIGRGTIKIMEACKLAGLKSPKWTTTDTRVKLSFALNIELDGSADGAIVGANDDGFSAKLVGAIDGAIDGATNATKKRLLLLLKAIYNNEGKRSPEYREMTKIGSERTTERYINKLKEIKFIEFKGKALQTGGYFITEKLKKIVN